MRLLAGSVALTVAVVGSSLKAQPPSQLQPLPLIQLDDRALAVDLDNRAFTLTFPQPIPVRDLLLMLALSWFYVTAAARHSTHVNTAKYRGDQSAYLWDAQQVYANVNGQWPAMLIGARARMPIYAGYLSLFYTPKLTDPEFFEVAKVWNIRLSVVLLAALSVIFAYQLPPLVSLNVSLVVAFGYFVFKAGYSQPELLFYFFFFVTFLGCWHLIGMRDRTRSLLLAMVTGSLAGLAYLTKALVPPFLAIFVAVYMLQELVLLLRDLLRAAPANVNGVDIRRDAVARFLWRTLAAVAFTGCFLAVVSPYILNNKRFFGDYFFNLNTTYYIWYDTGGEGRALVNPDELGYPAIPRAQMPTLATYWRSHTVGAIAARVRDGLSDLAARSYDSYGYLKYVIVYGVVALLLVLFNARAFGALLRTRWALVLFLVLYAAVYLPATAFFVVTSGTGSMRFLLAHAAPLFFALSRLIVHAPFEATRWRIGRLHVSAAHLNVAILVLIAVDLTFLLWPRLMTTYGGF